MQPPTTSVPEPSTLALLAVGVGLLAVVRRRAT
ncbi:PEP-CTERM sorting domain-containing protein [Gemmatimonas sp.]